LSEKFFLDFALNLLPDHSFYFPSWECYEEQQNRIWRMLPSSD